MTFLAEYSQYSKSVMNQIFSISGRLRLNTFNNIINNNNLSVPCISLNDVQQANAILQNNSFVANGSNNQPLVNLPIAQVLLYHYES